MKEVKESQVNFKFRDIEIERLFVNKRYKLLCYNRYDLKEEKYIIIGKYVGKTYNYRHLVIDNNGRWHEACGVVLYNNG